MVALSIDIEPLAYAQKDEKWLADFSPYCYQHQVYRLVKTSLKKKETLCLFLTTPTGSGKTLASYAYAINNQLPAIGVYPTNELIRDQERALKPWIDPKDAYQLLRIDSRQLDHWQDALDKQQHAQTLETLMNWKPTILTNPDILFYTFFGLYKGPSGLSQRLFSLLGQYRLFIFDEFHLYNVKQMADVAFLVATLHTIHSGKGRVFIFASATPDSPARDWLRDNIRLPVEVVKGEPSSASDARTIAYPLQLTLLPADLRRWQGVETLKAYLPTIRSFVAEYPEACLVTILDSVAGSIETAQILRQMFPNKPVGEIHGLSSAQEREEAIRRPFTVGTSTIEVGIDFKDDSEKDLLIYEARTAAQSIQRFGRLARHKKHLTIPNRVVALVPEYVYHFMEDRLVEGQSLTRHELYRLMDEAYQKPEDFAYYLKKHAPAEFTEARRNILSLFQPDEYDRIEKGLSEALEALTGKSGKEGWGIYHWYKEDHILQPLLTFRGSGFEAAVLDERGTDPGFPVKRYNLMFLLRRGDITELGQDTYMEQLDSFSDSWPEEVARERRYGKLIKREPEELLGVYGYFRLSDLREDARKVCFEIGEDAVQGRKAEVTVISGLKIVTEPGVRLRRLNRHLRRKQIVAWFADVHPAAVRFGRALPPLFAVYNLRVRKPGGRLSEQHWSIVFNQDAFFVDSLGWWKTQQEDTAIIL
jgi:CRISPR-associated helicase Cas3